MDARTNLEFGENLTWELSDEVSVLREYTEQVDVPDGIVIVHQSFEALARVCVPYSSVALVNRGSFVFAKFRNLHQSIHGTRYNQSPIMIETDSGDRI